MMRVFCANTTGLAEDWGKGYWATVYAAMRTSFPSTEGCEWSSPPPTQV